MKALLILGIALGSIVILMVAIAMLRCCIFSSRISRREEDKLQKQD